MQTLTFIELAEKLLTEEKRPMTSDEIWQTAVAKQYDKLLFTGSGNPQVRWNGTLEIDLGNNFHPLAGMTFDLFDFDNTRDSGTFTSYTVNDPAPGGVPLLAAGLTFDYSQLYVDGTVSVVPTPEPTSVLLLAIGGMSLTLRRRSRNEGIRPRGSG